QPAQPAARHRLGGLPTASRAPSSPARTTPPRGSPLPHRWVALTRRVCISNNAVEREIRSLVRRRKNWTARLNNLDPTFGLANVPRGLQDHPAKWIDEPSGTGSASACNKPPRSCADQNRSHAVTDIAAVFAGCVRRSDKRQTRAGWVTH